MRTIDRKETGESVIAAEAKDELQLTLSVAASRVMLGGGGRDCKGAPGVLKGSPARILQSKFKSRSVTRSKANHVSLPVIATC